MVGRGEQLAALRQSLDRVRSGSPAVVLLGGEAGAGKTRLIAEFVHVVAGQAVLLSGACIDLGGEGLAFAPFTAALRGLVRQVGAEGVVSLVPGGVPVGLGRLLPALGGHVSPDPGADAGAAQARLYEELLGLLENLADQRPVVLVIEDAHWADRSSRELISFLARNLQSGTALLILVSYRTDGLDLGHPLRPLLAELERLPSVQRVELPRLTRHEVIKQIRGILGGPGPAGLVEEVVRRSDGNPLFVEALLDSRGDLPESLADLLLARVRRLPEATQQLLGAADAAGALAYAEQLVMLDRVLELWDAVPDAAALAGASRLAMLEQAAAAAHLAGEPAHGVLLADALLAEPGIQADPVRAFFVSERRAAMSLQLRHPDVAALREAAGRVADDDPARARVLAALAEHLIDAQLGEELYEQGEQALAAARRSRDLIAEASALITVAALTARRGELAAQLPRLAEARAIAERVGAERLLLRALHLEASVLEAYGQHERAAEAARRGITAAAAAGLARTSGVSHAASLAEALTSLGRWDQALEVTEHALSLLPPAGPRLHLLRLAGSIALARGDFAAAAAALGEARQDAPASGDSFGTFEALMLTELEVALLAAQGDAAAALDAAQRVLKAEGARAARLKRFLWPLLATTARVACVATAPGSPDELIALGPRGAPDGGRACRIRAAGLAGGARSCRGLPGGRRAGLRPAAGWPGGRPAGRKRLG